MSISLLLDSRLSAGPESGSALGSVLSPLSNSEPSERPYRWAESFFLFFPNIRGAKS